MSRFWLIALVVLGWLVLLGDLLKWARLYGAADLACLRAAWAGYQPLSVCF